MSNKNTPEFHPAAGLFPLDEKHLDELAEDIKQNGQQVPIEIFDGKVLDGRRRLLACAKAGVEPIFRTIQTDDPIAYVLSGNLHRRHLTPAQRAMVGARARKMYAEQAKERQRNHGKTAPGKKKESLPKNSSEVIPDTGDTRDLAGKAVGVSGFSIDAATTVLNKAVPEVIQAVDEGRMAVSTAAVLASQPEDVQRAEATNPKRRRTYNSVSNEVPQEEEQEEQTDPEAKSNGEIKLLGVGVIRANEAVDCLVRIPKNDPLRKRGFQIVKDWIRRNP